MTVTRISTLTSSERKRDRRDTERKRQRDRETERSAQEINTHDLLFKRSQRQSLLQTSTPPELLPRSWYVRGEGA